MAAEVEIERGVWKMKVWVGSGRGEDEFAGGDAASWNLIPQDEIFYFVGLKWIRIRALQAFSRVWIRTATACVIAETRERRDVLDLIVIIVSIIFCPNLTYGFLIFNYHFIFDVLMDLVTTCY